MRILLFSQFFPPEIGATQTRMHAFAAGLAARGHDVEVICEIPNHPQGIVHPDYGGRLRQRGLLARSIQQTGDARVAPVSDRDPSDRVGGRALLGTRMACRSAGPRQGIALGTSTDALPLA